MRFELQGRGERAPTLSAFEFDTLEDFGEALEALETDTPCLAFAPRQSPPPFTILAAFALAVKILASRSGRAKCTFPTRRGRQGPAVPAARSTTIGEGERGRGRV